MQSLVQLYCVRAQRKQSFLFSNLRGRRLAQTSYVACIQFLALFSEVLGQSFYGSLFLARHNMLVSAIYLS